jgi:hypothetical protein
MQGWCPRCSGAIEFADGAPDSAMGRCEVCGVRISLGGYQLVEWSNDFDSRVKAVDWSRYENGEDKHELDFRYALAFHLKQLAFRSDESIRFVERALFREGRPLAIAQAAKPFLQEIVERFGLDSVARLVEQIG